MKHYSDIIIAPVITEKSMAARSANVYTFKVAKTASKDEIKRAVEEAFKVKVVSVNTLNTKSKRKEELEDTQEELKLIKKLWLH